MREILFRGKAINRDPNREYRTEYINGDWVYGLVTRLYDERFEKIPAEMRNTDGISNIEVDYKTLGAFTGLTDSNGTKIFEGDILKFIDNDNEVSYYEVVYSEADYRWIIKQNRREIYDLADSVEKYMTVVGNIYDNLELLEGLE